MSLGGASTMRGAVLSAFGQPLTIDELPAPEPGPGEAVIDIFAAPVPSYADRVFSGARSYLLEPPVVPGPGGVGRVRALGPDATRLRRGDWVFCDATVRARDDALAPETILQGWTARTPEALPLYRHFRHGSYAAQMKVAAESVTPIGEIEAVAADRWCTLATLLVPYGGLRAAGLQPGEIVVINGATGGFGSAGVAAALAMGAGTVVATGRNEESLDELATRLGPRVRAAPMIGDEERDRRTITDAAGGMIDCVLDLLPREAEPSRVLAAIHTVRARGRIVLMGGVGRGGGPGLEIAYPWLMRNEIAIQGVFMYPRAAVAAMVGMVRAGLLDLDAFTIDSYPLDDVNLAIRNAAETAGPLRLTTVRPPAS